MLKLITFILLINVGFSVPITHHGVAPQRGSPNDCESLINSKANIVYKIKKIYFAFDVSDNIDIESKDGLEKVIYNLENIKLMYKQDTIRYRGDIEESLHICKRLLLNSTPPGFVTIVIMSFISCLVGFCLIYGIGQVCQKIDGGCS